MSPEEKVLGIKLAVGTALKLLGERLDMKPEGVAWRLGCTFSAYSKWLRGERMPSGGWLLKILALCPDEETRNNFLDIAEGGSTIRSTPTVEVPIEEKEARPGAMRADARTIPPTRIRRRGK